MYSLAVSDDVMIAHSFVGEIFGPAQQLHGATYAVEIGLRRAELADRGRSAEVQMIDSTHIKAHRSAAGGKGGRRDSDWPLARRPQHENTRNRRC